MRFSSSGPLALCQALIAAGLPLMGCAAVYPEVQTPLRVPTSAKPLEPPPPPGLYWVAVKEGFVPEKTRDGRAWHELGNKLPDPFAVVFVNGKELIRTNTESSTLHPTWPGAPHGNFRFARSDKLRIEMWETGIVHKPMCVKNVGNDMEEWAALGEVSIECDGGARLVVGWEPAHGKVGYGFYYEFRTLDVYVSRVFEESPAAHAGLKPADQLVRLGDRLARDMKPGEVASFFNLPHPEGISVQVRHEDNSVAQISLKEGAVYPLFTETGDNAL